MSTTSLTTILGLLQAVGTALFTAFMTATQEGTVDWASPTFWFGMGVAAIMAIKGYYTKGIDPTPAVPK